ncbi:uncharacterized protein CTRU02_211716 [Colletotrichum truncatum]|uniref:Uncharacterized protein n=1 Tax=Colletotrichum truncatum TaxID=5467 RepID=A0ACC3YLH1_COLTU|nr:uncharacterized protein CTRU02_15686 [Colletotrichum truncatum]KAF6780776.1 hypothetical protein CTRU02_15686 [Colletotrichum truncatum]
MGKRVTFAKDMDKTVRYNALEEADADDDFENFDKVDSQDDDACSPSFLDNWNHECKVWDQNFRRLQKIALTEGVIIAILLGLVVFLGFQLFWHRHDEIPLGVDPSGFVPPEIGQPLKWMKYDDESDPHFFKADVFESLESVQRAAREFKMLHNGLLASNVRINGKYTTYMDFNDEKQPLPAYITRKGSELYSIRAFHQMHCVSIIFEDIGYRVLNKTPKWETGHVIHCLNTLRSAVTCLADATPISYVNGMGVGHTTDDQQSHCRDFFALREWAHDPVRSVKWMNVAPDDKKDVYQEILP